MRQHAISRDAILICCCLKLQVNQKSLASNISSLYDQRTIIPRSLLFYFVFRRHCILYNASGCIVHSATHAKRCTKYDCSNRVLRKIAHVHRGRSAILFPREGCQSRPNFSIRSYINEIVAAFPRDRCQQLISMRAKVIQQSRNVSAELRRSTRFTRTFLRQATPDGDVQYVRFGEETKFVKSRSCQKLWNGC